MKRSLDQKAATKRAWTILRLRGAYALFKELKSEKGMYACDLELAFLGAIPESDRESK